MFMAVWKKPLLLYVVCDISMSILAVMIAPLIGIMLALFGAGGGMLTVPLLNHVCDMPLKSAVAASLWIVAAVSLVALFRQRAWHQLQIKLLAFFIAGGGMGSWLGAHLGLIVSDALQGTVFGLLVWFVAWWMRYRKKPLPLESPVQPCRCLVTLLTGVLLGIVTGMLGVGGGFMMVPALLWLGISDYKIAVSHSLVLIIINAVIAGMTYFGHVEMAWQPVLWIAGLAAMGTVLGSIFASRVSSVRLQSTFSLFLVLIGAVMLFDAATH